MDKFAEMEISSLILLTRANNNFAFSELVKRYTPMINKVISGFDIPNSRVEEAVSDAHVALYRAAKAYDLSSDGVTFGLYARICVYNKLCDFVGSELREDLSVSDVDADKLVATSRVESNLVNLETVRRYLSVAKGILSDYEYEVFRLYLGGYTSREIAGILNQTSKSVDNAKNRMMKRLRRHSELFF